MRTVATHIQTKKGNTDLLGGSVENTKPVAKKALAGGGDSGACKARKYV